MQDLSYLTTEYARNKMIASYDREAREREKQADCRTCQFKRRMMSSYPGHKLPGIGKCIRPGGYCEKYKKEREQCRKHGKNLSLKASRHLPC